MSDFQESQIYSPQREGESQEKEKDLVYKRRLEKLNANSIEGKWTEQQNLKYALYMDYHSKIFNSKEKRKSERIFKSLSTFLTTRTPRQCRSHFQKMMNKFKKLSKIKQHFQELIGPQKYQTKLDNLSSQLTTNVKQEESQTTKDASSVHTEMQTDPFKVRLSDLSNEEMVKLMGIYFQYQKILIFHPPWKNGPIQRKLSLGQNRSI